MDQPCLRWVFPRPSLIGIREPNGRTSETSLFAATAESTIMSYYCIGSEDNYIHSLSERVAAWYELTTRS